MSMKLSRREMMACMGGATAVSICPWVRGQTARKPEILEIKTISRRPDRYHGWPTLARRKNGELLVSYSGNREGHVCPFGRVEWIRSTDDGKTWSDPETIIDRVIDDRDSGVLETAKGSILVTTFTSLAYEKTLAGAEKAKKWSEEKLRRWRAADEAVRAAGREKLLGVWMVRSTDGGRKWSEPYDCLVSSPHGPIQLADGRLLYAGKDLWRPGEKVGVCQSSDDGQTWQWLAETPVRSGDSAAAYHELHAVECKSGRIVLQIRNHNKANAGETLQCESSDGGKTWSEPHAIGVWGLPSHLLRLADGRLLMTYGHRRAPLGNQARLSADEGKTWSDAIVISGDATSGDLGYPSTVELPDGSLVTVWYELMAGTTNAVLRQARWLL